MTYQLREVPIADLLKLRLRLDAEVWRRYWWVVVVVLAVAIVVDIFRRKKR